MVVFVAPLRLLEGAHMETGNVKEEEGEPYKEQRPVRWWPKPE